MKAVYYFSDDPVAPPTVIGNLRPLVFWTKNKVNILRTIAFPSSSKAATRHCNLEHNVVSPSLLSFQCFGTMNKKRAFGYSLGWTKNKAFRNPEHYVVSSSLLGRVVTTRNYSAATSLYKNTCLEDIPATSCCMLNIRMNSFCFGG